MFRDLKGLTRVLHHVPLSWTVGRLREELGEKMDMGDVVKKYRFIWAGKQLEDS
jgi:hypothetical protein